MKKILLIFIIVLVQSKIYCQKKLNNIYVIFGEKIHPDRDQMRGIYFLSKQISVGYNRKLNSNVGVNVEYSSWRRGHSDVFRQINDRCEYEKDRSECNNKVYARKDYQFFDIGVTYNIFYGNFGSLSAQFAFGLVWGEDWIQDSVILPQGASHNYLFYSHKEYNKYLGICPAIVYNYYFFNRKINTGVYTKLRKYAKIYSILQYEFGIHLGYNF